MDEQNCRRLKLNALGKLEKLCPTFLNKVNIYNKLFLNNLKLKAIVIKNIQNYLNYCGLAPLKKSCFCPTSSCKVFQPPTFLPANPLTKQSYVFYCFFLLCCRTRSYGNAKTSSTRNATFSQRTSSCLLPNDTPSPWGQTSWSNTPTSTTGKKCKVT